MLKGKKILVGVTAGIAAYKTAFLIRLFIKAGVQVKVIMTPASKDFVTPLTLSTLSKNPVYSDFSNTTTGEWANHVELGLWADLFVVAPASANTIAKMANGICDNLLLATYLSAKCPVYIAPAMDLDMYKHASTKKNLKAIESFGNTIINPGNGELASGLHGEGRMAEPQEIFDLISDSLKKKLPLAGKKALVTAGPTYENIDPVRFIGNYSSGKMGFAIAEEFAKNGAEVVLVSGPTNLQVENLFIKRIEVISAEDMYRACIKYSKASDYIVMSAAVADFTPKNTSNKKIKKSSDSLNIELLPTKDILSEMGKQKTKKQVLVGFALETNNELQNAKIKLKRKNLDFIVLNSLNDKGAGFKNDTNKVTIITRNNKTHKFELKSKSEVAKDIIKLITTGNA